MTWRLISPDPPEGGELPATEFIHPLPLLALALLAVNDHLLKGAGWLPGWLTGKLSDFAGMFFFPLLISACVDVALYGLSVIVRRTWVDFSLRRSKIFLSCSLTGALMIGIKLSPTAAAALLRQIERLDLFNLFSHGRIVQDPSDLLALSMLPLAYLFARQRIAEIPPGRLAWINQRLRRGGEVLPTLRQELADCAQISGKTGPVFAALIHGLQAFFQAPPGSAERHRQSHRAGRALHAWRS